jgi:protoheme IX farnesyltransferase
LLKRFEPVGKPGWIKPLGFQFRYISLFAALAVFLLIVAGGVLRAADAGGACSDWPACFGQFIMPREALQGNVSLLLDYLHRALSAVSLLLSLLAGGMAMRSHRGDAWITLPTLGALGLIILQIFLGGLLVGQAAAWLSGLHLGLSLLTLAGLVIVTVLAFSTRPRAAPLRFQSPFALQTVWLAGLTFVVMVSGALLSGLNRPQVCAGWPLCTGPFEPAMLAHLAHRGLVLVASGLAGWVLLSAWRRMRYHTTVIVAATTTAVLFIAQALLGARLVQDFPIYLLGLHQATSVAVWATLAALLAAVGIAQPTGGDELTSLQSIVGRKGLWRDLLLLTKPIVVALLLVTTFAGMVIGARAWPTFALAFWTLLGGFMAAGGSGAINQFIDRDDDIKMHRTQKRPIPAGRLTPGEGLAFGIGLALASFYLLTALVNFTAALLSLAGIFYYVILYSLILKKTTVQNIVIGGGAGAIPPLVGWAAATGGLNIPSLFLFAVIFMWTPPHFWALALVRARDYARAGVPMLPVIRGEQETRWQILVYTLELVGLTLLLPLFGLGGSIYLVGAAALGGWLILAAWKVWKQGGNKLAWKMYRYSSMYLAFLFVVLMVDALL